MSSRNHQSTFGRQMANKENQLRDEGYRFGDSDRSEQSRSRKRQLDREDMSLSKRQCSFGRQTTNSGKRPRYEDSRYEREHSNARRTYDSRKKEQSSWQNQDRKRQADHRDLSLRKYTFASRRQTTVSWNKPRFEDVRSERKAVSSRVERDYSCRADWESSSYRNRRANDLRRNEASEWQKDARRQRSEHRELHSRKSQYSIGNPTKTEEIKPLEEVIIFEDRKSSSVIDADDLQEQKQGPMSDWQKEIRKKFLDYEVPSKKVPENKQFDSHKCYNCMGKLNFADCQKEKDHEARISHQAFLDAPRYRPGGEISRRLREALGLGDWDLPEYIHRMRKMGFVKGYPPGYLKQAYQEIETVKFITEDPYFDKKNADKPTPMPIINNSKVHSYIGFNKHDPKHEDKHQIPPFAVYCQMLQNFVERRHEDEQEKQRELSKEQSVSCDAGEQLLQIAHKKEVVGKKIPQSHVIPEDATSAPMGSSVAQIIGTPVFPIKGSLRPLEDFAKGILPFERNEEVVVKRGLFDVIMKIINDKKKS